MKWSKEKILLNLDKVYRELMATTDTNRLNQLKIDYITIMDMLNITSPTDYQTLNSVYQFPEEYFDLYTSFGYTFEKDSFENIINHQQELGQLMTFINLSRMYRPKIFFKQRNTEEQYLKMVEDFFRQYDLEHYELFLKLLKGNIEISKKQFKKQRAKGLCYHVNETDESFITAILRKVSGTAVLAHEVAHAYQMQKFETFDDHLAYHLSSYRESYPRFVELLLIDYYRDGKYKNAFISSQYDYIDELKAVSEHYRDRIPYIEEYSLKTHQLSGNERVISKKIIDHIISDTFALYLFELYKNDKSKFDEIFPLFMNNIGCIPDSEITEMFPINIGQDSFKTYLFDYNKKRV